MKYMMLLVIVADMYFAAQAETAFIRRKEMVQDFQDRSFAGPVITYDRNFFPSFDSKI